MFQIIKHFLKNCYKFRELPRQQQKYTAHRFQENQYRITFITYIFPHFFLINFILSGEIIQ